MLLQKNIVKKYLALLPDEQTQEAWKWVREPSLDPFICKQNRTIEQSLVLRSIILLTSRYLGLLG